MVEKQQHIDYSKSNALNVTRPVIYAAEQAAREWALSHGHKVVSDIVSQGEYRAWVQPVGSQA